MARQKAARRPVKRSSARKKRVIFGYPVVVFLLLCTGVFLLVSTFPGLADNIHVTAKVSGPLVTSPAVITSPTEGQHFSSVPISVSGTCPANAAYVEIFRNNVMSGSAICDASQNFQLSTDLFPGANALVAHVFNLTDDEGPVSSTVNVTYDVPQPPAGSPAPAAGGSRLAPLIIKTQFIYRGYHLGDLVEWPLEISGGQAPYGVNVDWGDGSQTVYQRTSAGAFMISHRYFRLPNLNKSFVIKVSATDAKNNKASIQFFVLVTSTISVTPTANIFTKPTPTINSHNWLWIAWPAYLIVLLMALSYWLGEREEMIILNKKGLLGRSRRR